MTNVAPCSTACLRHRHVAADDPIAQRRIPLVVLGDVALHDRHAHRVARRCERAFGDPPAAPHRAAGDESGNDHRDGPPPAPLVISDDEQRARPPRTSARAGTRGHRRRSRSRAERSAAPSPGCIRAAPTGKPSQTYWRPSSVATQTGAAHRTRRAHRATPEAERRPRRTRRERATDRRRGAPRRGRATGVGSPPNVVIVSTSQ